jgi:hypothetical protein
MNIKLNNEIVDAEIALTAISTRLVCTYRDLIELKTSPASADRDAQIHLLEVHIADFEHEINRIGILLKYDADLVQAMIAQCDEYANRLVAA